jgi:hypothetical protein
LIAPMCSVVTFGMVAAIVIEGLLSHFDLLVTRDRLLQDMIKPVPRAPSKPSLKLSLVPWKFFIILVLPLLV